MTMAMKHSNSSRVKFLPGVEKVIWMFYLKQQQEAQQRAIFSPPVGQRWFKNESAEMKNTGTLGGEDACS